MKKWLFIVCVSIIAFVGCSEQNNSASNENEQEDELKKLEVAFKLPEEARTGEKVTLEATVTYGGEPVEDAEEMNFEYWNVENAKNTTTVESSPQGEGVYTAEVTFDQAGTYEIYAHTTAESYHTMPKKSITINE
ncbi:hypothetical protein J416_06627 [Gracilibacillus halophilus YIM-C55.5]|uniref:YtkA-like domain-containing protein n=1 Tax=Gracilibacillus halophilus YIM-C55.5 TaxID=1308866 RepID=N4WD88_9BACI|nr:FixH family protein [Gracilibacillus halophilus]ENH97239.1 hypothetical protein J416_06627 [Gracilibacillus halophilus YIM-C55.5]